ncbi:MAG: competence/damage-inducible protein A, partial [Candidatus Zixiibacteriota bacterium]
MWTERLETPVEIISIGDELLSGYTVNSNAAFIGRELLAVGLPVRYVTTVGDSMEDMESTFAQALKRAKVVITTGGLGPTDDDLTRRAIVKLFKRNLVFHEDIWEEIRARYAARGIEIPPVNQNQALLPQGATIFPNKHGSAVGICLHENGRWFIALPGVPYEMRQILTEEVIPYLREKVRGAALQVRTLRTTGIAESALAELIKPQIKIEPGVKLAY